MGRKDSKSQGKRGKKKKKISSSSRNKGSFIIIAVAIIIIAAGALYFVFFTAHGVTTTTTSTISTTSSSGGAKWKILYVDQGNGVVNESNFQNLLSTVESHGFNTIFFQIYRSGSLLFSTDELNYFVSSSHNANVSIFFALYFTNATQEIPTSVYTLGENGISLDMSALPLSSQDALFSELQQNYHEGKTAITTTDFGLTLKPDLLVLETYDYNSDEIYVRHGVIGSVLPLELGSRQEYEMEYNYDLANSDGVMVFDYYGLTTKGY